MKYAGALLFSFALIPRPVSAISMVYNFRIAQITKQAIFAESKQKNHTVALLFDQWRQKYNGTHQNFVGGLGSYIRDVSPYYFRVDFAAAHIHENEQCTTTFSGTETDDLLFTLGRNFKINDHAWITLSGLFGVPTHRLYRLQHIDFGYSLVGGGIQLDGGYDWNDVDTLLYGARYIHFVPRLGLDPECERHRFTFGNIGDLFLAHKRSWERCGLEFGYTFRARFGAQVCPSYDEIVTKANYVRSNFYGVYKHKFFIHDIPNRLLFYISYGFDHSPKVYGNKYIVTLWTSWNISF